MGPERPSPAPGSGSACSIESGFRVVRATGIGSRRRRRANEGGGRCEGRLAGGGRPRMSLRTRRTRLHGDACKHVRKAFAFARRCVQTRAQSVRVCTEMRANTCAKRSRLHVDACKHVCKAFAFTRRCVQTRVQSVRVYTEVRANTCAKRSRLHGGACKAFAFLHGGACKAFAFTRRCVQSVRVYTEMRANTCAKRSRLHGGACKHVRKAFAFTRRCVQTRVQSVRRPTAERTAPSLASHPWSRDAPRRWLAKKPGGRTTGGRRRPTSSTACGAPARVAHAWRAGVARESRSALATRTTKPGLSG